ncbi:MAG TPA: cell division protein FtsQ/DivIB [Candidatus Omnitrophota bacterium]|nr:cell division protein FtsQ/DivIB [Candidatus Omnitrophota bacterium]
MSKRKHPKRNFVPLLVFLPVLAIGLSSYAVFSGIRHYTETSSYFNVRQVEVEGISDARYCDVMKEALIGTNIFRIDTIKLSERIKKKFPTFYSVSVTRVLPSCLRIVAKERLPVAIMQRAGISYLFDTEGVIVAGFPSGQGSDFPLIVGLEDKFSGLKVGSSYNSKILKNVLSLAKALRLQRFNIDSAFSQANRLKITRIDASQPSELSFYFWDTIQIKVGRNDFENKINLLPAIIKSLAGEINNVKYIDLRPKEPVVASKNPVKK